MSTFATRFRTETVEGLEVAYREAGDPARPTLVLLHGFPSSGHMYRNLIAELADEYHLVAPDHIGFGASAAPPADSFPYTFEKLTEITLTLLDRIGVDRFALYVQDYGAPIGLRIAARHPERITGVVTQNGNAYTEGFTPFWDLLFAYATDPAAHEDEVRKLLTADSTRWQYTHGTPADRLERIAPDAWRLDQAGLDRPGNDAVQLGLFRDYRLNLDLYPVFQEYFRTHRPPLLAVWGRNDGIFGPAGAEAFARDLPDAEIHLLDAGHFALESHGEEIAALVREFLRRAGRPE
ncbi:alpha/beta fold hydrolase [Streptomyces clavuligerus]|nr:alpha/beta hydrolase [Streptomyces clavuligerus]ANW19917.1 alpha/beta hydrolase [Streptomyces clavuligerus]AXU14536.1 alpha/beta hydrolase [Streptomyces clavuligerus]EDY51161.1 alpha/beta hydrolase fold-containing protein [Streptomyces clavuligerus]MBY6304548.1 alpha/beta hydrolase [Streptomyces clavuligerus]QCS07310.1 alpha/beta hydrolase [Streptomyces clavuligerus]